LARQQAKQVESAIVAGKSVGPLGRADRHQRLGGNKGYQDYVGVNHLTPKKKRSADTALFMLDACTPFCL
jgi:hypothetical protein